ncbi:MAG: hypothetical protein IJG80_00680 [Selenomonadaceae bacterium]|nr:hypothetical protein [Selenomonadaceae bacterium]MBQ3726989.1 hypothetical protein [Selenomonadaceae bacterium]
MPESVPLEEVVEHTVNAIQNGRFTYGFEDPDNKLQPYHLLSVSRIGDRGCDVEILQRRKDFFNEEKFCGLKKFSL